MWGQTWRSTQYLWVCADCSSCCAAAAADAVGLLQVNVEEVKREHKEAADRVVEAVQTALAEGLHQQQKHNGSKSSSGDGSSGSGSAETAAAVDSGAAAGSKRKQQAGVAAAGVKGSSGSPAKKRKPTMLDLVEGSDSGSDSDDSDAE